MIADEVDSGSGNQSGEPGEQIQGCEEEVGGAVGIGVLECIAQDKNGRWRVVLVGESKHQGNDVEKIKAGIKQGKKKQDDLMVAGNAIERVHKNILEIRNLMLDEAHFPYVVFLQGSNFATETFSVETRRTESELHPT